MGMFPLGAKENTNVSLTKMFQHKNNIYSFHIQLILYFHMSSSIIVLVVFETSEHPTGHRFPNEYNEGHNKMQWPQSTTVGPRGAPWGSGLPGHQTLHHLAHVRCDNACP